MPNFQGGTKEFYAYVHARPDGSIFYVGKGSGKRKKLSEAAKVFWAKRKAAMGVNHAEL